MALLAVALLAITVPLGVARHSLAPERLRERVRSSLAVLLDAETTVASAELVGWNRISARGVRILVEDPRGSLDVETDLDIDLSWWRFVAPGPFLARVHAIGPRVRIATERREIRRLLESGALAMRWGDPTRTATPPLPAFRVTDGRISVVSTARTATRTDRVTGVDLVWDAGLITATGEIRVQIADELAPIGQVSARVELEPFSADVRATGIHLDGSRPVPGLGPLAEVWDEISPKGVLDLHLSARGGPRTDSDSDSDGGPALERTLRLGLSGVDARVPPIGIPLADVHGSIDIDFSGEVEFHVTGTAGGGHVGAEGRLVTREEDQGYDMKFRVEDLALDEQVRRWVDELDPEIWASFGLGGTIDSAECRIAKTGDARPEVELRASTTSLELSFAGFRSRRTGLRQGFDYPAHALEGSIEPDGRGGHVMRFQGRRGRSADGFDEVVAFDGALRGPFSDPYLELRVLALDIPLDDSLRRALPPEGIAIWDDFAPRGRADCVAHVVRDGTRAQRQVTVDIGAELKDVAFAWKPLPFPIEGVNGELRIRDGLATFRDLEGRHRDGTLAASGSFGARERGVPDRIRIRGENLPLESVQEALGATSEPLRELLDDVRPRGRLDLDLEQTFARAPDRGTRRATIRIRDGRARVPEMPLRFVELDGTATLENDVVRVESIRGRSARLRLPASIEGIVELAQPLEDSKLDVVLSSDRVPLTEELRAEITAFRPGWDRIWQALRPGGALQLRCEIRRDPGAPLELGFGFEELDGRIDPPFLPEPITDVRGTFDLVDGRVSSQFAGRYRDASIEVVRMLFDPTADRFEMEVTANGLSVRGEDLGNLPPEIRDPLEALGPRGPVDVESLEIRREPAAGTWTATADLELGGLTLTGGLDFADYRGEVLVRRARFSPEGAEVSARLTGDVRFAGHPFSEFLCEVSANDRGIVFDGLSGKVYGGKVSQAESRIEVGFEDGPRYSGRLAFRDVRMKQLLESRFPNLQSLDGYIAGSVDFEGAGGDVLDLRAEGDVRVEDATLFEVPILNALVRLVPQSGPPIFTGASTDFRLRGARLRLRDLQLYSAALSLYGQGRIDLEGGVDLVLFPEFVPDLPTIVVVSDLWRLLQNGLIAFRVTGFVDEPIARLENVVTGMFPPREDPEARPVLPPFPDRPLSPRF